MSSVGPVRPFRDRYRPPRGAQGGAVWAAEVYSHVDPLVLPSGEEARHTVIVVNHSTWAYEVTVASTCVGDVAYGSDEEWKPRPVRQCGALQVADPLHEAQISVYGTGGQVQVSLEMQPVEPHTLPEPKVSAVHLLQVT